MEQEKMRKEEPKQVKVKTEKKEKPWKKVTADQDVHLSGLTASPSYEDSGLGSSPEKERITGGVDNPSYQEKERVTGGVDNPSYQEKERVTGGLDNPSYQGKERVSGGLDNPSYQKDEDSGAEGERSTKATRPPRLPEPEERICLLPFDDMRTRYLQVELEDEGLLVDRILPPIVRCCSRGAAEILGVAKIPAVLLFVFLGQVRVLSILPLLSFYILLCLSMFT